MSESEELDNCSGVNLVAVAATIATFLAENLDLDNQNIVGNVLQGVGQNLLIIAAQNSKYQNCLEKSKENDTHN